ncbi:MAG: glycosyltransferase family 9 protein [Planctomycetes bacterium]|nr:glycosyltransferase family 9 protein [Planctomycetota bacterium]
MKLSTMRSIDAWVGRPACFLLGLFVRVFGGLFLRRPHGAQRALLFIELSEMGSTIVAASTIQRALAANPQRPVCFVIFKKNVSSLHLLGLLDERNVFTIRDDSLVHMLVDTWRFVFFCRARGIDTAIDLELFARVSSILSLLSGASTRVGFDNFHGEGLYRGAHLTHRVQYNPYQHMAQNFQALFSALECDPRDIPLVKREIPLPELTVRAPVRQDLYDYVRAELSKLADLSKIERIVLLNHDAGKLLPIRTWPAQRFAEVARALLADDEQLLVVLCGIPDAQDSAQEILTRAAHPRCINFVGKTRTLADLLQLFHQADLLISNDSGPPHFASLTDIATITLFGPETPRLYGPLGPRAVHLYKALACSPCLTAANHRNSPCQDNQCLKAIGVDEVLAHARKLLGERRALARAR